MHELIKALGGFNTSNNNDNTQPRAELHQSIANRPVSYSNVWTGSSMKWRLMRAN